MTAVRRLLTLVVAAGALSLTAQTRPAQTPATTPKTADVQRETAPVAAETDNDVNNPRALKMSLNDAVGTSVKQNLGVEMQQYSYLMSGEDLRGAYGAFDWYGTGTVQHSDAQSPSISRIQATGNKTTIGNFGVGQLLPTGATYNLTWTNSKSEQVNSLQYLNPTIRSGLDLQLTQPLLRNFGTDISRRGIYFARNTLGINREAFRAALLDTVSNTQQAYLDLIYARRYVDVVKESVFLARDQARITQIRIDVGASAPLDILQPRVQIATTEEQLINAVAAVRGAEDRLRTLLNLPQSEWDRPIIPTDNVRETPVAIDADKAIATAYQLRPEMRQSELAIENKKIQYVYARNQVLPKVDLALEYGTAGVAGTALATDPLTGQPTGLSSTSYSHALSQVVGRDFPTWVVGVNLGVPIMNYGAKAEAKRAELDLQDSRAAEEQTRQNILVGVRQAIRLVETLAKNITASRAALDAAEQNLAAEQKRYENGMTTLFQVLQIQEQLTSARATELQSLVGYNKAVTAYHAQIGDLLDVRGISVDPPPVQEPTIFSSWDKYNWLKYGSRIDTNVPNPPASTSGPNSSGASK